MLDWEKLVHAAIAKMEAGMPYIQKGLAALRDNPDVRAVVKLAPFLEPYAEKLIGLIPVAGQVMTALEWGDLLLSHGEAIVALGAALHFAPADVRTFPKWQNDYLQE